MVASLVGGFSPLAGCERGGNSLITAPSGMRALLPLESLGVTPQGMGVQYATEFIMEAVGSFPADTTFRWAFGDGSSASGQRRVVHVYDQLGTFSVSLEVSSGEDSASLTRVVRVGTLVGTWDGVVTGHTAVPSTHPVPMTSFVLTVFAVSDPTGGAPVASTVSIDGSWTDDAGCLAVRDAPRGGVLTQTLDVSTRPGFDPTVVDVVVGIQHFECNGERFAGLELDGTADHDFNNVVGACAGGGQHCRFRMQRRRFLQSPPPVPGDVFLARP